MTVMVRVNLADELNKMMHSLIHKNVYVGIPGNVKKRKKGDSVANAQLGYIHEKGSPKNNIPARPFLVPGVKAAGEKVSKILGSSAVNIKDMESIDVALNKAGLAASQSVKSRIRQSTDMVPLKAGTIKARSSRKTRKQSGSIKPLIDTGQLINSITYVVKE